MLKYSGVYSMVPGVITQNIPMKKKNLLLKTCAATSYYYKGTTEPTWTGYWTWTTLKSILVSHQKKNYSG